MDEQGTPSSTAPAAPAGARISIDLEIAGATLLKLAGHIQAQGEDNLPNAVMRSDARTKLVDAYEALGRLERLATRQRGAERKRDPNAIALTTHEE